MMSLKKNRLNKLNDKAFTIVELIIVIVVIAILSLLVLETYSSIQARVRNKTRQDNITKIQEQLEGFFSQNGYYPSLSDMNSTQWLDKNMKNLDQDNLIDPSNPSNSKELAPSPVSRRYSYHVTDSSGNSCERTDTECAKYTLTATYEGTLNGSDTFSKSNID